MNSRMNAARLTCPRHAAVFSSRSISRGCWRWFLFGLISAVSLTPAGAETLFMVSGWVQAAPRPYSNFGEFVLMNDPLDRVRAVLADPDQRFAMVKDVPGRCRLQVAITQPRGPGDEPVFRIVTKENAALPSSSPDVAGSPGWTALTSDLYAADMNVVPRRASFIGDDYADGDGDGTPDAKDDFPGRPEEWSDTDGDGSGNNADLDDDGDGMSDTYELANGLNPLIPDAAADADSDGVNNGDEAIAGTRADDRSSFFLLSFASGSGPGGVTVQWQVLNTRLYVLESSIGPAGPWVPLLLGFRPAADGIFSHAITPPSPARTFYRATVSIP